MRFDPETCRMVEDDNGYSCRPQNSSEPDNDFSQTLPSGHVHLTWEKCLEVAKNLAQTVLFCYSLWKWGPWVTLVGVLVVAIWGKQLAHLCVDILCAILGIVIVGTIIMGIAKILF